MTRKYTFKLLTSIAIGGMSILFSNTVVGYMLIGIGVPGHWVGYFVIIATGILMILGILNHLATPIITSLTLQINKPIKSPITVVQLSDIHINGLESLAQTQRLVHCVNQLNATVVVFTGDLLDIPFEIAKPHLTALSKIKSKHKFAISGNHDFYSQYGDFKNALRWMGFDCLDNKIVWVEGIQFVGLPDKMGRQFGHINREVSLVKHCDPHHPIILLDHRPDTFKKMAGDGIDIQLSGHTHWGQIPPWGLLIRLRYRRFGAGYTRLKQAHLYVSKGSSTWGPPLRLYRPSEIVHLSVYSK